MGSALPFDREQLMLPDLLGEVGNSPNVGLLFSGVAAHAQGGTCSNAILQGAYGGSAGMFVLPAPGMPVSAATARAVLLRFSFDGKGNFTAAVILNDDGTVSKSTDAGTYVVNPDCTRTVYTNGGTRSVDIVVVDSGNEFYSIRTNPPNLVFIFNAAKPVPLVSPRHSGVGPVIFVHQPFEYLRNRQWMQAWQNMPL